MKEESKLIISLILVIMASFLAGFLLRPQLADTYFSLKSVNVPPVEISQCGDLPLKDSVYCLRDYVNTFYKYEPRNDTFDSLEELKENGGDCYDWSKVYESFATQLGLKSKIINIFPDGNGEGHTFLIIWDKDFTGYCKTEITSTKSFVECWEIG